MTRFASALAALVVLVLLLSACDRAARAPMQALEGAERAIGLAERASVANQGSAHLSRARVGLAAARSAVTKQQMTLALQLADRSRADAQLAMADLQSPSGKSGKSGKGARSRHIRTTSTGEASRVAMRPTDRRDLPPTSTAHEGGSVLVAANDVVVRRVVARASP